MNGIVVGSETRAHSLSWFHYHQFVLMLERAGFDSITTCADFTKAPETQDTHTVIHSARHPH